MEDTQLWMSQLAQRPIPADRLLLFLDVAHLLVERTSRRETFEIVNLERDERENPQRLSLERIDELFANDQLGVTAERLREVLAELAFSFYEDRRHPTLAAPHPHWKAQKALRAFLRENQAAFGSTPIHCQMAFWVDCLPGILCAKHREEHVALARLYAMIASDEIAAAMFRK